MDLSAGFGRAQTLVNADVVGQPIDPVSTRLRTAAHRPAIGRERAIVPIVADFFDQQGMQGKAASGEQF